MITGNEPAMPSMANINEEGELIAVYESGCKAGNVYGLTIRQHFAVMAMQGLLSNMKNGYDKKAAVSYAEDAVYLADDLIAELNKSDNP